MRPRHALALLPVLAWLQPPPVLPLPSRSGADGPPRPYGVEPPVGPAPPHTPRSLERAQNRALLYGPFPHDGLARGVSDGTLLLSESAAVRSLALARIRASGARVVRIPVDWRDVVQAAPPPGFKPSDPASSAYRFGLFDAAVISASAAGLQPLLVVSHAPAFAEAPHRWPYAYAGSWAPNPAALQAFAVALARRYDGSFPDPLNPGRALPRVRLFQAWNEPNLPRYLGPQWVVAHGRWSAFSPRLYRELLDAFYAGVKSVSRSDTVVAAGIAPLGERAGAGAMAPVTFLQGMLCLPEGAAVRSAGAGDAVAHAVRQTRASCPQPPRFDVLAFHPLSVSDPDVPAASALDAAIADIAKVTDLLRAAERLHTALPAGRKPVWVTELNWGSSPPSRNGVPNRLQAPWLSRALHRLWVAGVQLVDWQFLIDPYPGVSLAGPTGRVIVYARPDGLYRAGVLDGRADPALARPKPFLQAFTFPFDPLRVDRSRVRVWALLARAGQRVALQRRVHGGWRTIARLRTDRYGVLNVLVRLGGAAELRLRSGGLRSAKAVVGAGRSVL